MLCGHLRLPGTLIHITLSKSHFQVFSVLYSFPVLLWLCDVRCLRLTVLSSLLGKPLTCEKVEKVLLSVTVTFQHLFFCTFFCDGVISVSVD